MSTLPRLAASRTLVMFARGVATIAAGFALAAGAADGAGPPAGLSQAEVLRLGERMYRQGILPSGEVMFGYIRGDVKVDSSAFSCSNCHLRAGLGSVEGGIVTPPVTGRKLYKPYRRPASLDNIPDRAGRRIYAETVIERPAYTRASLAAAIRNGVDPAGQKFNEVMPRYRLADRDMDILISYLETLSSEPSPGASEEKLRFATIVVDDVGEADRQALLAPLRSFIDQKNQQQALYKDFKNFNYVPTVDMRFAFRRAALDVWELKGPPAGWAAQLAAYYEKNPVFAVLGGISNSDWRPIHDFCEAQRLPCLFPITDFPATSAGGWYTLYFNKGYAQEGEAVARYLNRLDKAPPARSILQLVQDSPAGRALEGGFDAGWKELEQPAVRSMILSPAQIRDPLTLGRLVAKHRPAVLLLWGDAEVAPALPVMARGPRAPEMVFVSSGYMGRKTADLHDSVRDRVYITFPYRLTPYVGPKTGGYDAKIPILTGARDLGDRRITSRTTTMLQQATLQGLNLIYDNLYRDHLLDVMGQQMDITVRDYERLSFGPGQRAVSKGCYIVQLGPGAEPQILPRSDWVIQ